MTPRPTPARHESTCPECGTRIHLGDPIRHDEDHDDWVHASCSEAPHTICDCEDER